MTGRRKVLFLCTGNACRSQMAEAILRHLEAGRFEACSAGSHPAGFVHPLALEALRRLEIPLEGQTSKGWDTFKDTPVDVVITLCDQAAGETCPVWPGNPIRVHWSLPDPAGYLGNEETAVEFALRVARRLCVKIEGLIGLDWSAGGDELAERLRLLGEI